jgi:murein DD-endopeptidase MepM/ murein hydrolase activator NlpD
MQLRGIGLLVIVLACGCSPASRIRDVFRQPSPYEQYVAALREARLDQTALGAEWIAAGEKALAGPRIITLPHRAAEYLPPSEPSALAYRLDLRRGERFLLDIDLHSAEHLTLFVDLFRVGEHGTPQRIVSLKPGDRRLEFEPDEDHTFILRLQPELLRGGRVTLTQRVQAALMFPVPGHSRSNIQSFFGAARQSGDREHQGIDIFAARGTPAVAAADALVTSISPNTLGGNVVWLWDPHRRQSLYYAHLDRQAVRPGTWVKAGDVVGFVGNTGNARTTTPHLHFGIYRRPGGPVDPIRYVLDPPAAIPKIMVAEERLGGWSRVSVATLSLRTASDSRADAVGSLPRHTAMRVLGATGTWLRVELPNRRQGFVPAQQTAPVTAPLRTVALAPGADIRAAPEAHAPLIRPAKRDERLPVLGRFGAYSFVRLESGLEGWAESDAVSRFSELLARRSVGGD